MKQTPNSLTHKIMLVKHRMKILLLSGTCLLGALSLWRCTSSADALRPCQMDGYFAEAFSVCSDPDSLYALCYGNVMSCSNDMGRNPNNVDKSNIAGTDNQTSDFIRSLFNLQELPTDEAMCAWGDVNINTFVTANPHHISTTSMGFYLRIVLGIRLCDHYLNQYANIDPDRTAEVRLLRAFYHLTLLDNYGDTHGQLLPSGTSAFDFIESETQKALNVLPEPFACTDRVEAYGKMNKGVARMILARLYINALTYSGTERWADALAMARALIDCGVYSLSQDGTTLFANTDSAWTWSGYHKLFMADNGSNGAQTEAIWPLRFDSDTIVSLGGSTFLTASTFGAGVYVVSPSDLNDQPNGTIHQWSGNRAQPELVKLFVNDPIDDADSRTFLTQAADDRALFFSKGRMFNCQQVQNFFDGYTITKFINIKTDGSKPQDRIHYSSADYFMMRLAEAYLIAAEASWRLGKEADALQYLNVIRDRAHAARIQHIAPDGSQLLDEWAREFYFEGRRRTDLRRFEQWTGPDARKWQWKGGVYEGRNLSPENDIYDLPDSQYINKQVTSVVVYRTGGEANDMYYLTGDGIGSRPWSVANQDLGLGLLPMVQTDTAVVLTDYLTTNMHFKLIGNIGNWDEQYGMGSNGNFLRNDGGSGNIVVPKNGLYTISINRANGQVSMTAEGSAQPVGHMEVRLPDGSKIDMKPVGANSPMAQTWMADVPVGDHGYTRCKIAIGGNEVGRLAHRYGQTISYDRERFMMFRVRQGCTFTRLIYNVPLGACYFADMTADAK